MKINKLNNKEKSKCKSIEEEIDMLFNINKFWSDCSSIGKKDEIIWVVPLEIKEEIKKIKNRYD